MVDKELQRILEDMGITKKWVLQKHIDVVAMAEEQGKGDVILRALDAIADYLEMKPQKGRVTEQLEMGSTLLEIGNIMGEAETMKLTRQREIKQLEEKSETAQ